MELLWSLSNSVNTLDIDINNITINISLGFNAGAILNIRLLNSSSFKSPSLSSS